MKQIYIRAMICTGNIIKDEFQIYHNQINKVITFLIKIIDGSIYMKNEPTANTNQSKIFSLWQKALIVLAFMFFYFIFFAESENNIWNFKGIFCTAFLGVIFWIIVLSIQRKRSKKKSEENKNNEVVTIVKENNEILKSMQKSETRETLNDNLEK